jgi:tryptophan-rich sensory protein
VVGSLVGWSIKIINTAINIVGNISHGLKMEITFKRRLTNELLTTFLPSFLLLGITYATTFFKRLFFEAALVVNLTVMLVITTLFIRQDISF